MELYDTVFNAATIYDLLFLNVKAVLEYPTLRVLGEKNPALQCAWNYIAENYYTNKPTDFEGDVDEYIYKANAIKYPEFMKIVAISYGKIVNDGGEMKRHLKVIVDNNEFVIIDKFIDVLNKLSSEGSQSSPKVFDTFCGYNIINTDIPLLVKRFIVNRNSLTNKKLPLILKMKLSNKPWETGIIDAMNVWKFNGINPSTLTLMAEFLGLNKSTDVLSAHDLSEYYWQNIETTPEKVIEFVKMQSATQTNLVIQLMRELRLM